MAFGDSPSEQSTESEPNNFETKHEPKIEVSMERILKELAATNARMGEIEDIIPTLTLEMVHLIQTDSMVIADRIYKVKTTLDSISTEADWEELHALEHKNPTLAFTALKRKYEKAGQDARVGTMLIELLLTVMEIQQSKIELLFVRGR